MTDDSDSPILYPLPHPRGTDKTDDYTPLPGGEAAGLFSSEAWTDLDKKGLEIDQHSTLGGISRIVGNAVAGAGNTIVGEAVNHTGRFTAEVTVGAALSTAAVAGAPVLATGASAIGLGEAAIASAAAIGATIENGASVLIAGLGTVGSLLAARELGSELSETSGAQEVLMNPTEYTSEEVSQAAKNIQDNLGPPTLGVALGLSAADAGFAASDRVFGLFSSLKLSRAERTVAAVEYARSVPPPPIVSPKAFADGMKSALSTPTNKALLEAINDYGADEAHAIDLAAKLDGQLDSLKVPKDQRKDNRYLQQLAETNPELKAAYEQRTQAYAALVNKQKAITTLSKPVVNNIESALNQINVEHGLPAGIKIEVDFNIKPSESSANYGGCYPTYMPTIRVTPKILARHRTVLASVLAHEDEHFIQDILVVAKNIQEVAGADPLREDQIQEVQQRLRTSISLRATAQFVRAIDLSRTHIVNGTPERIPLSKSEFQMAQALETSYADLQNRAVLRSRFDYISNAMHDLQMNDIAGAVQKATHAARLDNNSGNTIPEAIYFPPNNASSKQDFQNYLQQQSESLAKQLRKYDDVRYRIWYHEIAARKMDKSVRDEILAQLAAGS